MESDVQSQQYRRFTYNLPTWRQGAVPPHAMCTYGMLGRLGVQVAIWRIYGFGMTSESYRVITHLIQWHALLFLHFSLLHFLLQINPKPSSTPIMAGKFIPTSTLLFFFLLSMMLNFPENTTSQTNCQYPQCVSQPPPATQDGPYSYPPPQYYSPPTGDFPYNPPPSYGSLYAPPPPDPILPYFPYYYKHPLHGESSATALPSSTLLLAASNLLLSLFFFYFGGVL